MKLLVTIIMFSSVLYANPVNAYNLRRANRLAQKGLNQPAQKIYSGIADSRAIFNSAYAHYLAGQSEAARDNYIAYLAQPKLTNELKARAHLNLGNLAFEAGELEEAKDYYRRGLLLDSADYRLKYNLELVNQMEADEQQDGDSDDSERSEQQEQAERVLDALAQRERQLYYTEQTREDAEKHVEKNW